MVDGVVSSMTRWCNNGNVLRVRFAHFQRVLESDTKQSKRLDESGVLAFGSLEDERFLTSRKVRQERRVSPEAEEINSARNSFPV